MSAWIGTVPVQTSDGPIAELRAFASTLWPDSTNDYGNLGGFHEYNFLPLTPAQTLEIADGLEEWADGPTTRVIFQAGSSDNHTGVSFTGLNGDKNKTHVVVARVYF